MKLGSKVAELENAPYKIGDHVAGFTHGGVYKDRGAYAEYVKATYNLCWKVPEGSLTHEQAATMGCGYVYMIVDGNMPLTVSTIDIGPPYNASSAMTASTWSNPRTEMTRANIYSYTLEAVRTSFVWLIEPLNFCVF